MNDKFKFCLPGQFGGGDTSPYIDSCMMRLSKIFKEEMQGDYMKTVNDFTIILRVASYITDFEGGDGPEVLRHVKKSRYIKVDLVIPESKWKGCTPEFIRDNFSNGIRECFYLLVGRAEKNGELLDKQGLIDDFERSMAVFKTETDRELAEKKA